MRLINVLKEFAKTRINHLVIMYSAARIFLRSLFLFCAVRHAVANGWVSLNTGLYYDSLILFPGRRRIQRSFSFAH